MSQRAKTEATAPDPDRSAGKQGPLAIIAGRGSLPSAIADATLARGRAVHIFGIHGEADPSITRYEHTWLRMGELGKLMTTLEGIDCRDLVIIGAVTRPDFGNLRFDFGAIKNLPFILSLGIGGDDQVLSSIVRFFESRGYRVHGAAEVAPELLAGEGALGVRSPSADDLADISLAFRVISALGRHDVGQGAVVVKGRVLAVEAAEGTDAMLARAGELKGGGRRAGVLAKAPKPGQEERVDMPTIGPDTISSAAAAGLAGIAIAAGKVLIADRAATIAAADRLKMFVYGQPLLENDG